MCFAFFRGGGRGKLAGASRIFAEKEGGGQKSGGWIPRILFLRAGKEGAGQKSVFFFFWMVGEKAMDDGG